MLAEDLISRYLEGSDDTLSSVKSLIKKWRMRPYDVTQISKRVQVIFPREGAANEFVRKMKAEGYRVGYPATVSAPDPKFKGMGGTGGPPQVKMSAVIVWGLNEQSS